jgi:hypothetical protein
MLEDCDEHRCHRHEPIWSELVRGRTIGFLEPSGEPLCHGQMVDHDPGAFLLEFGAMHSRTGPRLHIRLQGEAKTRSRRGLDDALVQRRQLRH